MNKKHLLITITFSAITLIGGYFYGNHQGEREAYLLFMHDNAIESVFHTQALYAIESNQIEDSKKILRSKICSNLMIIGSGLRDFPQLENDEMIQGQLAMPSLYAKDFDIVFCGSGSDSKEIEGQALSLANNYPDSYDDFLNKYRKVKIEPQ